MPCRCGSKTGYHMSHCPLRYAGTVIQEDHGAWAAMDQQPSSDPVENKCMSMYDKVLDLMGGSASPEAVTRLCETALEVALWETEKNGEHAAARAVQERLDWFTAFAPR